MGGISSVATWPEYSGKGIAGKLIKHSLTNLRNDHTMLAYLHPFNAGFYRRFGFEFAFDQIDYTIPIEKLRYTWEQRGIILCEDLFLFVLYKMYDIIIY